MNLRPFLKSISTNKKGIVMRRYIFLSILIMGLLASTLLAQPRRIHQRQFDRPDREQMRGERGEMKGLMNHLPDLTEEQSEQIENLRIEHLKVVKPIKNQLAEKKVQLKSLSTADKVEMSKINAKIEEVGALKTQLMKEKANHHQSIRKVLTEKQRVIFDNVPHKRQGHGQGRRR